MVTRQPLKANETPSAEIELVGYELRGDAIVRSMERLALGMRRHLASVVGSVPGGIGGWWVLHHLDRRGPQAQVDMARSIGVASSTLTLRLKQMEEVGLVTRTPDENDQRRMVVALTERGEDVCQEQRKRTNAEVDRLMAGADSWDVDAFRRVMRVIQENLFKIDPGSRGRVDRDGLTSTGGSLPVPAQAATPRGTVSR